MFCGRFGNWTGLSVYIVLHYNVCAFMLGKLPWLKSLGVPWSRSVSDVWPAWGGTTVTSFIQIHLKKLVGEIPSSLRMPGTFREL